MVIPVPAAITREQIYVADASLVAHVDAYGPRLVNASTPTRARVSTRWPKR